MSKSFSDFTIISPALNEAENITELIETLSSLFPEVKIIVADDGSTDGTQSICQEFSRQGLAVTLLDRSKETEKGITASVLDAIQNCKTTYFAVIDADLQHPPEVLQKLFVLLKENYAVVSGARIPYQENQGMHRIIVTRLATYLAKIYLRLFKKLSVQDPMSGFFAAKTDYVQSIIKDNFSRFELNGYKVFFDLLKSSPADLKFSEIQYQFRFRKGGQSKLKPMHALYFLRGMLR